MHDNTPGEDFCTFFDYHWNNKMVTTNDDILIEPFIDNLQVFPLNKAGHLRFSRQHGRHQLANDLFLHLVRVRDVPLLQPQLALPAEQYHELHLQ